jgi:hypothetical protein
MKSPVLLLLIVLAGPPAALADVDSRVFISPSGEPFRPDASAPDGFETWFARVDTRHDGHIERSEFRADAAQFFKRLDTNGDGAIDGFEVAAYEKTMAPELDISGQGFARGGSSAVEVASLLSDPEPVSSADINLNSHITLAEWLDAADRRFDLLDTKHLGYLGHDQLKALLPKPDKKRK